MEREVKVQRREPATVLAKRLAVTLPQIGGVLGTAFGEVYGSLEARGGDPDGPPFVIYHGIPSGSDPFDIEICVPVRQAIEPPAGWHLTELPGGMFASLLHVGPYDSIGEGYDSLSAWIAGHDLAFAGPPREVYLSEPETPAEQVKTIIEWPVVEVVAPVR